MIYAVGFRRLDFIRTGTLRGRRTYRYQPQSAEIVKKIRVCALWTRHADIERERPVAGQGMLRFDARRIDGDS